MNKINEQKKYDKSIIYILFIIFIITRFFLISYKSKGSDTRLYSSYAIEAKTANEKKINFYDYHEEFIDQKNANKEYIPNYNKVFPFTPLALNFLTLPNLFIDYNHKINEKQAAYDFYKSYLISFKFFYFIFEIICFLLLIKFIRGCYKNENFENFLRMLFFIICGILLLDLTYDRYDYMFGIIIGFALLFLLSKKNYILSFFFLTLAVHFKIPAVFLLPLFIVGTLPSDYFSILLNKKTYLKALIMLFKRTIVITGMIILLALFFILIFGKKSFNFLFFYTENYIQIESLYSSFMLLVNFVKNINIETYHAFGQWNLNSDIGKIMEIISTPLVLISLFGLFFMLIYLLYKKSAGYAENKNTFAQAFPDLFIIFTYLFIAFPLAFSKNFSPQYLLWFTPILMLLPLDNKYYKIFLPLFLLTSVLTILIFPYRYFIDIVNINAANQNPTLFGSILLITRNFLFLGMNFILIKGLLYNKNPDL